MFAFCSCLSYSSDCSTKASVLSSYREVPAKSFIRELATTSESCATSRAARSQVYSAASRQSCRRESIRWPIMGRRLSGEDARFPSVR